VGGVHAQRSDPLDHTHRRVWSNFLDPMVRSRFDENAGHTSSCAVIDVCRPFPLRDRFPKVAESSAEFRKQIREEWAES
jgi:hypothetical protein